MSQGLAQGSGVDQNGRPWVSEPSWTQPVYKWGTASVPVTKEVLDDCMKTITDGIFRESPILDYLNKKTKEAEDALKKDINRAIWGEAPVRNEELRRCIGDAYDKHVTPKEAEVSIASEAVNKVMRERAEERAAEVIEKISNHIAGAEPESTVAWNTQFKAGGKEYNYVAVLAGDGLWYVSNRNGGLDTETFISLMAEQAIDGTVSLEGEIL